MRIKATAGAIALGITLAACGGGSPPAPVADDGSTVTLPVPADGPVPDLAVSAEADAASPLPAVTVRRLNGDGGWVQFKNELPADRSLLIWFWAPH